MQSDINVFYFKCFHSWNADVLRTLRHFLKSLDSNLFFLLMFVSAQHTSNMQSPINHKHTREDSVCSQIFSFCARKFQYVWKMSKCSTEIENINIRAYERPMHVGYVGTQGFKSLSSIKVKGRRVETVPVPPLTLAIWWSFALSLSASQPAEL